MAALEAAVIDLGEALKIQALRVFNQNEYRSGSPSYGESTQLERKSYRAGPKFGAACGCEEGFSVKILGQLKTFGPTL